MNWDEFSFRTISCIQDGERKVRRHCYRCCFNLTDPAAGVHSSMFSFRSNRFYSSMHVRQTYQLSYLSESWFITRFRRRIRGSRYSWIACSNMILLCIESRRYMSTDALTLRMISSTLIVDPFLKPFKKHYKSLHIPKSRRVQIYNSSACQ